MREDLVCSCSDLSRAFALTVVALAFCFPTSAQAADTAKAHSRPERRWFVLLGGSSNEPVWTVCCGRQYQNLPPLYAEQVVSLTPIVEAALGIQSIIVSTDIVPVSRQTSPDVRELVRPAKLSPEELCAALLQCVRRIAFVSDNVVLELQPPLTAMFSDAYLSRYSEQPAILSVSRCSQDAMLRLCRLTRQLATIARLMQGEKQANTPEVALTTATDIAVIETTWKESILQPYGLVPLRLHVWESLSTIEIVFPDNVPFTVWAGVIAGKKLAGANRKAEQGR